MTVGKIYVGLLIAENWKAYKQSQLNGQTLRKVSQNIRTQMNNLLQQHSTSTT